MTATVLPHAPTQIDTHVALAAREGLTQRPKRLPPWLFYDADGSRLFDEITRLPEYYLTRTEREILSANAAEIVERAAQSASVRLRIAELGAGSAYKTRLLLSAAARRQQGVLYEPVDVSASALAEAREHIEREIPGVHVLPHIMNYMHGFALKPSAPGERRLVLYIGSSIGNFEPQQAAQILQIVRAGLEPGDALLLGVDLKKDAATLLAAYDDAAGVTACFNLNMLARLNRELAADFDLAAFAHRAVWNTAESRMEMHLESLAAQAVNLPALGLSVAFAAGERIHTENSYKYAPGQAEALLTSTGFAAESTWTDARAWFAVCLARAE